MSRWMSWLPLLLLPIAVVIWVPTTWPRWTFMWVLAFAIYCGCKWLTWRSTSAPESPLWRRLAYLLAWPGMDAIAFLTQPAIPPSRREWSFAFLKCVIGFTLLYGVVPALEGVDPYIVGWVGMIGIIMVLHFGSFHLLSCLWRTYGAEAKPLMNAPLLSRTLSEFWGRRWNTAFRDLTHRYLFRPMTSRLGMRGALAVGFVFSGVVHDVVISFPAGGGYGGPTLYFLIQGAGLIVERTRFGQRLGRPFTLAVLLLPAPLLFHPPFVLNIVIPFLVAIGAMP